LTEEEMLQLALQQSMEQPTAPIATTSSSSTMVGPVPPEPEEGSHNSIKIQFRLPSPHNSRIIRRFYNTNKIADIHNYVRSIVSATTTTTNHQFECMVGFPPKNMLHMYPNAQSTMIQETNLANTTIQVRFLS
jgi:UBX domain